MRRLHTSHGRWLVLASVLATVGALCGAPSAAADTPGPVVSFLDTAAGGTGYRWLSVAAPDGTSPSRLTSAGYDSFAYDVSEDGNTLVVGLATNSWKANSFDRIYALMYVHREGDVVTSHVLANEWDAEPSLSADGSTAWWMSKGVIWKYTGGTVSAASGSAFAPANGEEVIGFSVSPDGTDAAVAYYTDDTTSRLFVADMTDLRNGPYFEYDFTTAQITGDTPAWIDGTRLLIGTELQGLISTSLVTLGPPMAPPNDVSAGTYDVQSLGTEWWAWSDVGTTTSYRRATDLANLATAPTTARVDGATSYFYRPSTVAPPAVTVADNRAQTTSHLALSATRVLRGNRVVYASWAMYQTPLPGQSATDAYEVDRGTLQYSYDGLHWAKLITTSWARPVPWPRSNLYGNGYTQVLTRNTWFRWIQGSSVATIGSVSPLRRVVVIPIVTARVARSGSYRTVYGTATRVGGTAVLYRLVGGRYVKVAVAPITARGAYSFGRRVLRAGTYRVVTLADRSWGAGARLVAVR